MTGGRCAAQARVAGAGLLHLLALLLLVLAPGCAAPLVTRAGAAELDLRRHPAGSQIVEAQTADGVLLRGVHVPAGPEAPVVLHLLPRGASATVGIEPFGGFRETLQALRDLGFSSLVLDYRGVGASAGEVDSTRLPEDAEAMWTAALRIAGDRPSRIVIRGASLGTLAAAKILATGVRPQGVVLAAPVDARSVVSHAIAERYGPFGALLGPFVEDPELPGLGEILASAEGPVLVLLPAKDPLLPDEEVEGIVAAAASTVAFRRVPRGHEELVLRHYGMDIGEQGGGIATALISEETSFLRALRFRAP